MYKRHGLWYKYSDFPRLSATRPAESTNEMIIRGTKRARGFDDWTRVSKAKRRRVGVQHAPILATLEPRRVGATAMVVDTQNLRTGGFVGRELKFNDYNLTAQAISGTWTGGELDPTEGALSGVGQGDGESQRDGREFVIKSCHIRGMLIQPAEEAALAPQGDVVVRLALVLDTQTNGAQLNAEDVMDAGAGQDVDAFRNLQYSKRFVVLKDKTFLLPAARAVTNNGAVNSFNNGEVRVPFKMNYRWAINGLKCRTNGTASTVAVLTDNSLHLIGVYSSANTSAPTISYDSRIRFVG